MPDFNLPYRDQNDWEISFVDIETTGLKPGYHEMIDIGIVLSDLYGDKEDEFFCRIMPEDPDRASEEAVECNGFSVERWEEFEALNKTQAVEKIKEFYQKYTAYNPVIFCAYNESFDYSFLDHLLRSQGESIQDLFNYSLDLPSIAWGKGYHCLHLRQLVDELGIKDEPTASDDDTNPWEHTGLTGAKINYRIYRTLID